MTTININVFMNLRNKEEIIDYVKRLSWNQSLDNLRNINIYIDLYSVHPGNEPEAEPQPESNKVTLAPGGELLKKLKLIKKHLEIKIRGLRRLKSKNNRTRDTRRYPFSGSKNKRKRKRKRKRKMKTKTKRKLKEK